VCAFVQLGDHVKTKAVSKYMKTPSYTQKTKTVTHRKDRRDETCEARGKERACAHVCVKEDKNNTWNKSWELAKCQVLNRCVYFFRLMPAVLILPPRTSLWHSRIHHSVHVFTDSDELKTFTSLKPQPQPVGAGRIGETSLRSFV